jgi:hypothetical protein
LDIRHPSWGNWDDLHACRDGDGDGERTRSAGAEAGERVQARQRAR